MSQRFKSRMITAIMLSLKILFSIRTGIDTYKASGDLLNVMLIDVAFLAFWMVLAYGPDSWDRVKWVSAGFAVLLYAVFFWIGISVHNETFQTAAVAVFARLSGGALLAYDLWDYISELLAMRKASRQARDPMAALLARNAKLNQQATKRAMHSEVAKASRQDKANELALQLAGADWVAPSLQSQSNASYAKQSKASNSSNTGRKASYEKLASGQYRCLVAGCGFITDSYQGQNAHSVVHTEQELAKASQQLIEVER